MAAIKPHTNYFPGSPEILAVWESPPNVKSSRVLAHVDKHELVLITDVMFTLVGAVGVVWTGHGMAVNFGGGASHPWIQWSYWLLTFSGLIWLFVLVPIQLKQRALLKQYSEITEDYWRLSRIWKIAGAISTVLPLPIVYFMVTKTV